MPKSRYKQLLSNLGMGSYAARPLQSLPPAQTPKPVEGKSNAGLPVKEAAPPDASTPVLTKYQELGAAGADNPLPSLPQSPTKTLTELNVQTDESDPDSVTQQTITQAIQKTLDELNGMLSTPEQRPPTPVQLAAKTSDLPQMFRSAPTFTERTPFASLPATLPTKPLGLICCESLRAKEDALHAALFYFPQHNRIDNPVKNTYSNKVGNPMRGTCILNENVYKVIDIIQEATKTLSENRQAFIDYQEPLSKPHSRSGKSDAARMDDLLDEIKRLYIRNQAGFTIHPVEDPKARNMLTTAIDNCSEAIFEITSGVRTNQEKDYVVRSN